MGVASGPRNFSWEVANYVYDVHAHMTMNAYECVLILIFFYYVGISESSSLVKQEDY